MTTITVEQLYRKIRVGEYKTAIFYDRFFSNIPQNLAYFERYDCEAVEALETSCKDFISEYAGGYSIVLKKSKGGTIGTSCLCRINLTGQNSNSLDPQLQGVQMQPQMNKEDMKSTLLSEIKAEMQLEMLKSQNAMYQNQLLELNTVSGRVGLMAENFIKAKMGMTAPMFQEKPQLQGTKESIEAVSTEEQFTDALLKLKDMFGVDNLVKMANNYTAESMEVIMIKNALKDK